MDRWGIFIKRLLSPITILMVPHTRAQTLRIRVPILAVIASAFLVLVGASFLASIAVRAAEYHRMQARLAYLSSQFLEMKGAMISLKRAEGDFRKLFGLKSKAAVLESEDAADSGSLDMEALREQVAASMRSVSEIRSYIAQQKDLYRATPAGWPVPGPVSSHYGVRLHPVHDEARFHTGVDISVPPDREVKATADGIVSFAGWTGNGGGVVAIEHGHGFATAYAHNRKTLVQVGQRVARGETVALSGSTGVSTGPHVHYEIWRNGRHIDPAGFLTGR